MTDVVTNIGTRMLRSSASWEVKRKQASISYQGTMSHFVAITWTSQFFLPQQPRTYSAAAARRRVIARAGTGASSGARGGTSVQRAPFRPGAIFNKHTFAQL